MSNWLQKLKVGDEVIQYNPRCYSSCYYEVLRIVRTTDTLVFTNDCAFYRSDGKGHFNLSSDGALLEEASDANFATFRHGALVGLVRAVNDATICHLPNETLIAMLNRFYRSDDKAYLASAGALLEASDANLATYRHGTLVGLVRGVNHVITYHLPNEPLIAILKLIRIDPDIKPAILERDEFPSPPRVPVLSDGRSKCVSQSNWLRNLKVGDEVIHHHNYTDYMVERITRTTSAHVYTESLSFRRSNGKSSAYSSGDYASRDLLEANADNFAMIRHVDLVRDVQAAQDHDDSIARLSNDALVAILRLMLIDPDINPDA